MAVVLYLGNSSVLNSLLGYLQLSAAKLAVKKKKKCSSLSSVGPTLEYPNGTLVSGVLTVAKQLVRLSSQPDALKLLGRNTLEKAQVQQWLDFTITNLSPILGDKTALQNAAKTLDRFLEDKVYFVTHNFSLPDIMIFQSLSPFMGSLTFAEKEQYLHLSRWYDQVQHVPRIRQKTPVVIFHRELLFYC